MPSIDRQNYLDSIWEPYPSMRDGSLRVSDLKHLEKKFLPELRLGAKVLSLSDREGLLRLGSQDEIWEVELKGAWPLVGKDDKVVDGRKVIQPGDCIWLDLNDCQWGSRSLQARIETMVLLAPCQNEYPGKPGYWVTGQKWSQFVARVREYFTQSGCREVWTPSLVVCPGMEPTLDPLEVQVVTGSAGGKTLYLPTSPELHLKKLLAMGTGDLFEIKVCYRDGEVSDHHQPEFWMLEWYRAFADLKHIGKDIEGLLQYLYAAGTFEGVCPKISQCRMSDLFRRFLDFDLTPETSRRDLTDQCYKWQLPIEGYEPWDDLFHLLFLAKIEPLLAELGPLIVTHFPPSQAALARLTSDGWADRFEFYWQGLEIANAFNELNDPEEQARRCERDNRERTERGRKSLPVDEKFLAALKTGMPPSGGIALGLERLFMAGTGIEDIRRVRAFSIEDSL
ncbi:MAG: EF-P lysine aminoacylase GenX [Bdellovibrionaceae bacterium]|nr:EF-P lysine aminoacylase GenX [Bdellovibrionales bacterium]MCB9086594.1 EF-P lysine aminoacylase GenX [Pseudobdellovibrionaceae bacterium]